jgi:hypothetical protein
MKYIRPEIEINEIQTEDVITLSFGNIVNLDSILPEKKDDIHFGQDKNGNPSIDVDADFFG